MPEPIAMFETLKSFVNTWECDENNHLNVQFYFERFDDADRHFRLQAGLGDNLVGRHLSRHVRYHRECHVGGLQVVRSAVYEAGADFIVFVHVLYDVGTGSISATALDRYQLLRSVPDEVAEALPSPPQAETLAARPRSFVGPHPALDVTARSLLESGGLASHYGSAKPAQCDASGNLDSRSIIAMMSNAAAHVWQAAPMTRAWLDENGFGRVAVEMRLTLGDPIAAGTLTRVITKWASAERTTFTFRHHLIDAETGTCLAIVDNAALVMDLETRKAVPLSASHREAILDLSGAGRGVFQRPINR